MLPKGFKNLSDKLRESTQIYSKTIQPYMMDALKYSIIQPFRSIIRFHHLKKAYNKRYRWFLTLGKIFDYSR